MPEQLIIFGRPLDWIADRLRQTYTVVMPATGETTASLPEEVRARATAAVCFGGGQIDAPAVAALPALKVVANFGAGYDRIDLAACRARGVALAYLPGVTTTCVADHALALMLAATRGVVAGHAHAANGGWLETRFPLMRRFSGRRLGVYGLGAIGMAAARRAAAFDMPIAYHNRRRRDDAPYDYVPTLLELARWADILLIACPATKETIGSIDATVLDALGPEGLLVNIARGSIVDETALIAALDDGRLGGAALDVFAIEPSRPDRLTNRPNVVLTPHIGGGTIETWRDTVDRLVANLDAFFRTGRVLDPIPG